MKKKMNLKRLGGIIALVFVLLFNFCLTACGEKPFVFTKEPPQKVSYYSELNFRDYFEKEDDALYRLYATYYDPVSGQQVTDRKQSSLVFVFGLMTEYEFRIERTLEGKKSSITCKVGVLPPEPTMSAPTDFTVQEGDTLTFTQILQKSLIVVMPGDAEDDVRFTSVSIQDVLLTEHDHSQPESLAGKTSYTFTEEAIYTFTAEVENESGTASRVITVTSYDTQRNEERVAFNYLAEQRLLKWTTVEGAVAYRVWVDGVQLAQDVTTAQFSTADLEEGTHTFKVAPVYETNKVYVAAIKETSHYVGYERSKLEIFIGKDNVTWEKRPFAIGYVVVEEGKNYEYGSDEFSHKLQGDYDIGDIVSVDVYAKFDDDTTTSVASKSVEYGTITLKRMDICGDVNKSTVKSSEGLEYIEFDGYAGNVYMMVEFTGKNAPNFALRAKNAYSALDTTQTVTYDAGCMLWNSLIGDSRAARAGGLFVTAGFCSAGGAIALSGVLATDDANVGPGMAKFTAGKTYIQIVGFEAIGGSQYQAKIICKTFVVQEDGSLALGCDLSNTYNWLAMATGGKAIIYGNCQTGYGGDPESVSFKYYTPAASIAELVNGMPETSEYKTKLKTLLGL